MSDDLPEPTPEQPEPDPNDPFSQIPLFGDLFKMIQNQGSGLTDWSNARQFAVSIAAGGESEPNIDPAERIAYESLLRIAELQIANATNLAVSTGGVPLTIEVVNRTTWATESLETYRPMFERLTNSLTANPPPIDQSDPSAAFLAPLMAMMGPMMLTMTTGSMVGHLAQRSLGTYDLPIPRDRDRLVVVASNVEGFRSDWNIEVDDMRLWVCLNEVAHHAVLRIPHVRDRLLELLGDHASGFNPDPSALQNKFGEVDLSTGDISGIQEMFGDPEVILGAVQSDIQRAILPQIGALVAAIEGYVDHVMDKVGAGLIGSYGMLSEALRRRRVEVDQADRFVEQLLGLELSQEQYERGTLFISGVIERDGEDRLAQLWESADSLPTPAEIDAPGLWLARLAGDSDSTAGDLSVGEFEIPDDLSGLD